MEKPFREKAYAYAAQLQIEVGRKLGFGWDGIVFSTSRQSAIKVFRHERLYQRELDVYLRLKSRCVTKILEFKVPRLVTLEDDAGSSENHSRRVGLKCRRQFGIVS